MVIIPDELVDEQGKHVRVLRAWPRHDGSLTIEGRESSSGKVRAGRIDARGRTLLVPFRTDASLPGLTPDAPAGELLVHRLKRRAVVRTDGQYRKFVAGGKARSVADAHRAAATCLAASGLAVPDVVASDDFGLTLTAVPGLSLFELGRRLPNSDVGPTDTSADAGVPAQANSPAPPNHPAEHDSLQHNQWGQAWKLWADRWPAFVEAAGAVIPAVSGSYTATDEIATVKRWTSLAMSTGALHLPEDRVSGALALVARSLAAAGSSTGVAHRDLHDKQILAEPETGSVGVIDCDTLTVAEPALDLANLSVHLDFRVAQGLLRTGAATVGKRNIRAVADSLRVPEARLNAYAAATALRLACIYSFRPPYRTTARNWFAGLEANLRSGRPLIDTAA